MCRLSWCTEEYLPPDQIESGDALGFVRILSLNPETPGGLGSTGETEALASVSAQDIDQVAKELLRDKCLMKIPVR